MNRIRILILSMIFFTWIPQSFPLAFPTISSGIGSWLDFPLLRSYATQLGQVPLYKDESGFYVAVDLEDDEADASDSTFGPDTVAMMLGLYTSETLFISSKCTNCLNFTTYDCNKYACGRPHNSLSQEYPYFKLETFKYDAIAYLDYNYWNLKDLAIFAVSCTSNISLPYAINRYGVIGLGVKGLSGANFLTFPVFSVHIDKNLSSGVLGLSTTNLHDNVDSTTPVAIIQTDVNWRATVNGSIQIVGDVLNVNTRLIFDLNVDNIGFPIAIYQHIMNSFINSVFIQCSNDTYYPSCTCDQSVSDLPDMILNIDDQSIPIPPDIYVKNQSINDDGTTVFLNLRGLDCNLSSFSYVTCGFNDFIILGYNFMSYYYSVFDASSSTTPNITLYVAKTNNTKPSWFYTLIEVIGALAFIAVCVCCYCACTTKSRKKVQSQVDLSGGSSVRAPLMVSHHPASMVYTQSSSTHEYTQSIFPFSSHIDEQGHDNELRGSRFRPMLASSQQIPHEVLSECSSEEST